MLENLIIVLKDSFSPEYEFKPSRLVEDTPNSKAFDVYKNDRIVCQSLIKEDECNGDIHVKFYINILFERFENTEQEYMDIMNKLSKEAPNTNWYYHEKPETLETKDDRWLVESSFGFKYSSDSQLKEQFKIMVEELDFCHSVLDEYRNSHKDE